MIELSRKSKYTLIPVGHVQRKNEKISIEILPGYCLALKELETFSHVQVLWWFSEFEDEESRKTTQFDKTPFKAPPLGVFACRSPLRPNPIGLTTARIIKVEHDKGIIEIAGIDAYDGTPVLDLKAYMPHYDRVREVQLPDWASDWPEWLPEDGSGLEG